METMEIDRCRHESPLPAEVSYLLKAVPSSALWCEECWMPTWTFVLWYLCRFMAMSGWPLWNRLTLTCSRLSHRGREQSEKNFKWTVVISEKKTECTENKYCHGRHCLWRLTRSMKLACHTITRSNCVKTVWNSVWKEGLFHMVFIQFSHLFTRFTCFFKLVDMRSIETCLLWGLWYANVSPTHSLRCRHCS